MLILKYEDMKKDLPSAVATIAKFIGQDISKEMVEEIAHRTTFESMQKDSSASYARMDEEIYQTWWNRLYEKRDCRKLEELLDPRKSGQAGYSV